MAEAAVALVIDKLIPLLTDEANLLRGVHREVEKIERQLRYILAFLRDADSRAEAEANNKINHGVKVWVKELREVAFQIADVIDEYTLYIAQQQRLHQRKFINFFRRIACFILELKPRHDIASKIQDLKQKVQAIKEDCVAFGFNATQQGPTTTGAQTDWYDPRKDSHFLKETEVVGIESAIMELIGVLEDQSSQRPVISVVGMGGLGKTTLVHQVYDRVKGSFTCYAWIEVSQTYNKVELLRNLMKKLYQANKESVPAEIDGMDEITIITKTRDYLQGKSYVVVFDDVWNRNFWGDVKNSLPDDSENGGIFITTRDIRVAKFCESTSSSYVYIHQLQSLPREKAWELFCNKAFRSEPERDCPAYLNELSLKIVEKCEGLPLAIVVIAGLLSTKNKNIDEWRKLHTSLSSELENNEYLTGITKILSLSYNDLPYYLKSCFLYFGIFPEDYSISSRRLIRQWIIEGFVKPTNDKTSKEVAKEYLAQLVNRSLIQESQVDFDGTARSFRIHDILREIVLMKMVDLNFCQVLSGKDSYLTEFTRRLSLANGSHGVINRSSSYTSHVRSIFIFDKDQMPNHIVSTIAMNFKLLKVLDFEDAPNLDHLDEDIGNLFHLKSLSLRGTKVKSLPKSIGKLENLETLDLKRSLVYELPVEIKRLHKLQYLVAYSIDNERAYDFFNMRRGLQIKKGIGKLEALQKLYSIEAKVEEVDLFKELSKLKHLRKLGITKLRREDGRALGECIQKMKHLESLEVISISENETIDLGAMSSPPQFLQRLCLIGHLRKLPEWIPKLENLVKITIIWSKLEDDPLQAFQNLHNLLKLKIDVDGYYGEKLHFVEGAFPKLKVLRLWDLSRLNWLVIDEGALSYLEEFSLGPSPQLKELPSGFQHLTNLKLIRLYEMPTKFYMSFFKFQSLQTVPDFRLCHRIDGAMNYFQKDRVMEILKYMREQDQVEEWESLDFEEIWNIYILSLREPAI